MEWTRILAYITGTVDQELLLRNEYLAAENGILKAQLKGCLRLSDSNAILLHLAEKTGQFLPPPASRGPLLSWLMFVAAGVGPFSGQAVHFKHFAPEKVPYAHTRYQYEAMRHYAVLDGHLAKHRYMVGDIYSIVDMDVWGWARMVPFVLGEDAWTRLPSVKRLHDEVAARPAVARALALKDKFTFKTEMDDEARRHHFKHISMQVA